MEKEIRTRYAPSPTGRLHLGGARTALFNYLYAKNQKGKFILRIEDTDLARNLKEGSENQLNGLNWLGISPDISYQKEDQYGPYLQSKRLDIYQKYIDILLQKKLAYKCYCTKEELEESAKKQKAKGIKAVKYDRKCFYNPIVKKGINPVIRLYVEENQKLIWNDLVRGKIEIPSSSLGDFVILKSDGMPTYNFANVIDDHLMKITDVFRGEEHISNTGKQLYLYKLFNWEPPRFAHLTVIVNNDNKKLSKRDESVVQFIDSYKKLGYLPEAVFNFLSLLGWSPNTEEEIFSKAKLIEIFDVNRFSKSPSQFNYPKLKWTNNYYIKKLSLSKLKEFLIPFIEKKDLIFLKDNLDEILLLFQAQLREGIEIKNLVKIFTIFPNWKNIQYKFNEKEINLIKDFLIESKKIKFTDLNLENLIKRLGIKFDLKGKNLMHPLRLAFTGKEQGPSLIKTIQIYGKEKAKLILERFLKDEIHYR
ncbi:/ gltX / Glutamate--tRNA ligase /:564365 Reverse [Candidatus Hepatoplasma crinochetorum]|uniref:Glutamate--tRNA ligase n=1 Tax=Candidatus Hepatoplasma crinochetorum TaxID=295596 RepID=A0A0G7ZN35_9MOLU|nr:/ gltX / Glutamate--tRNA ligase /:564365 Reverse [Candidatus Hepatoplasma crinochetorum]